jgi:DNA-binding LytR/AlgR family response regulator
MTITCYIIDDESDAISLLKEYITRTPGLELIGSNQNPLVALDELTSPLAPDVTFIDVDMRQLSGLELAGMVNLYTSVVFTTAHPEFAIQAFEKEAFDYLLKPINYERFLKCIQRAKKRMIRQTSNDHTGRDDFFNIKSEIKGRMVKIRFDEVVYVEGMQNYITIHTIDSKHMTYLSMKEIEHHLPQNIFTRIHRSFIVNVAFVKVIERGQLRLENGESLVLGDYYKQRFLAMMDEHLVKTNRAS